MRTKINYYNLQQEKFVINEKDSKPIPHDIFEEKKQPTSLSVGIQDCLTEFINGKQPDSYKKDDNVIIEDIVEHKENEDIVSENNNIVEADFMQSDKPKLYKKSILSQFKCAIKSILKGLCMSFLVFVTIAAILQFFN